MKFFKNINTFILQRFVIGTLFFTGAIVIFLFFSFLWQINDTFTNQNKFLRVNNYRTVDKNEFKQDVCNSKYLKVADGIGGVTHLNARTVSMFMIMGLFLLMTRAR